VELECTTLVLHSKLSKVGAWIPVAHRRLSCHAHRGMIAYHIRYSRYSVPVLDIHNATTPPRVVANGMMHSGKRSENGVLPTSMKTLLLQ